MNYQKGFTTVFILCVIFTLSLAQHQWGQPGHDASKTYHAMHSPSINASRELIFVNKSLLQYEIGDAMEVIIDGNNVAYLLLNDTVLMAVQVRTGVVLWQFILDSTKYSFASDPVLGGYARLYTTYDFCEGHNCITYIVALDTDTGRVIWTINQFFTQDNLVYNANSGQLLFMSMDQPCNDPRECSIKISAVADKGNSWEIVWSFNMSALTPDVDPQLPLVGPGGDIFMTSEFNETHCMVFQLDGNTGNMKWISYPYWSDDIYQPVGVTSQNNYMIYTVYQDVTYVFDGSNGNIVNALNGQVVAVFYSDVILNEQTTNSLSRLPATSSTPTWNISIAYMNNFGGASIAGNETIYLATYATGASMLSTVNIKTGQLGWNVSWQFPDVPPGQFVSIFTPVISKDQTILVINDVSLYQVGCCSAHGICSQSGCACHENYFGYDCSLQCTSDVTCNGHGTCDSNGKCVCGAKGSLEDYTGADCSGTKYNGAFGGLLSVIFIVIFGAIVGGIVYYRRRTHNYERIPLGDR